MTNDRSAALAALLLRLSLGVMFLAHGLYMKIMTFGLTGTMGFFGSLGYPPILGAVVAIAETLAGIALLLGLWTRAVSLLAVPILIGAALQHAGNGWVFSNAGGGWEFPVFWIAALAVQALLGDGAYGLKLNRLIGYPAAARAA
ncbi:DoxX family protein [Roseomonas sp. 18066]|uniref:DoxX family protein n=1 Tax=Roseomonas sp. 18066 TaxID=2681412 RepID=UPI0013588E84|nr:DoxX family protein [Roseomonas sp. 18066]